MSYPVEWYQMVAEVEQRFPHLRPAQQRGLATWVIGVLRAGSGCLNRVIAVWVALGVIQDTARDALREWLRDGSDKSAPCQTQVEVSECFAPLLRWVLAGWSGTTVPLAIDVTSHRDRVVVIAISVLVSGTAIPVAWRVRPALQRGRWLPLMIELLDQLAPAVPSSLRVQVLADRGLWSPTWWQAITRHGWQPVARVQTTTVITPLGHDRTSAAQLVAGPGHAWVGAATVFQHDQRRHGTVVVYWAEGQREPWVVLTTASVATVVVTTYGLRMWIELGFRALKSLGFDWQRTRRTDPDRVARHWLVLAVAMLWTVAAGTRAEAAIQQGLAASTQLALPPDPPMPPRRRLSLFLLGSAVLRDQLPRGVLHRDLRFGPQFEPPLPTSLHLTRHFAPPLSTPP